jgi:predicted AAA+ superfamily ATPase
VLKKVYDFLDVRVMFTSSVALALNQSSYDLSRRTVLRPLNPFSFREYLFFKHNLKLDP